MKFSSTSATMFVRITQRKAEIPRTRVGILKEGVDERGDCAGLRKHNQQAEQHEDHDDRNQPVLLFLAEEVPELGEYSALAHTTSIHAFVVFGRKRLAAPHQRILAGDAPDEGKRNERDSRDLWPSRFAPLPASNQIEHRGSDILCRRGVPCRAEAEMIKPQPTVVHMRVRPEIDDTYRL